MNFVIFFILTTSCCLVVNKQWASARGLPKPTLQLLTEDPINIIVKGDTITLKCIIGSVEANTFYFVHEKTDGKNETLPESRSNEYLFKNIQTEKDGDYFCRYCAQGSCSEFSSPLNIDIRETFPRPSINVSPLRVVQPGGTVTITCSTRYSDVEFSLLRNGALVTNGGNPFSYVITNTTDNNVGYYACMYKSKTNGMQSVRSNAMKISILALPAPSMTWEEDPTDKTMLRINCTAPSNHLNKQLLFKLLDGSKVIEDEIAAMDKSVTFSITKPKYSIKSYQCMYQVELDYDYAESLHSILKVESKGAYTLLTIRHILSALILILIGIFILLHFKDLQNNDEKPPDLPRPRVKYQKTNEVIWTSDDK
ncbi:alpha-1B-glycoprotein-like [Leptodactylus fuscus]